MNVRTMARELNSPGPFFHPGKRKKRLSPGTQQIERFPYFQA
jgi:hypothetical protein